LRVQSLISIEKRKKKSDLDAWLAFCVFILHSMNTVDEWPISHPDLANNRVRHPDEMVVAAVV
jgi:hypothetical protein